MLQTYFEPLHQHFLEDFQITVGDKTTKIGKLRLLLHKDYFASLSYTDAKERIKTFELPYPYKLTDLGNGKFEFDYTVDTLCNSQHNFNRLKMLQLALNLDNKHEWFDKKVILEFLQPTQSS